MFYIKIDKFALFYLHKIRIKQYMNQNGHVFTKSNKNSSFSRFWTHANYLLYINQPPNIVSNQVLRILLSKSQE